MTLQDPGQLRLMNGGPALHWPLFQRNVSFTSQIRGNQSNLKFGIAFKQGGRGDGPRILCTNFVGLQLAIMIASIGSKFYLGRGFRRHITNDSHLAPP